ncbi:hypothetical protein AB834_01655 [PVC group bacterium (ex Bugula neritina AB1)]|nr:hypothetical protein AB834_01655 [PVC group bacterium (ex Bugula neritina AB1)]
MENCDWVYSIYRLGTIQLPIIFIPAVEIAPIDELIDHIMQNFLLIDNTKLIILSLIIIPSSSKKCKGKIFLGKKDK